MERGVGSMTAFATPNGCQEANMIVPQLACNEPATRMIGWPAKGEGPYRMCPSCAHHNTRNRGASDLGPFTPTETAHDPAN